MREFRVEDLVERIAGPVEVVGDAAGIVVSRAASIDGADEKSLVWLNPGHPGCQRFLDATQARVIITGSGSHTASVVGGNKVLLVVENPKLTYLGLVVDLFADPPPPPGIHPSAVVDPGAEIAPDVSVGPHTTIGKAVIGAGSIIRNNTVIRDRTRIGRNVEIGSGCVIGEPGLSLSRGDEGRLKQFPHVGGVVIEDDVIVQSKSVIDCGVLGDTVIGQGSMLNSQVYVAHNTRIGRDNVIVGNTVICGSVVTGDRCWFSAGTTVRDSHRIGNDVFVGIGSVVDGHLSDGACVMGVPARESEEAAQIRDGLKKALGGG